MTEETQALVDRLEERSKKHRHEVAECSEAPLTAEMLPVTVEDDEEPLPCKWCATRAVDAQIMAESAAALSSLSRDLETAKAERWFPIQLDRKAKAHPIRVPWSVAEKAYSVYSARYGTSQTLERLAERGGFSPDEMDDMHPNWRMECDEIVRLRADLEKTRQERDAALLALSVARDVAHEYQQQGEKLEGEIAAAVRAARAETLRELRAEIAEAKTGLYGEVSGVRALEIIDDKLRATAAREGQ